MCKYIFILIEESLCFITYFDTKVIIYAINIPVVLNFNFLDNTNLLNKFLVYFTSAVSNYSNKHDAYTYMSNNDC